jgi:hypothetical protein
MASNSRTRSRNVPVTRILGVLTVLSCAALGAAAQQKATLSKPTVEYAESFTNITAIRELPSGKVLVADRVDKTVQLVDLIAGTGSKVGREGNGPGEYALPMALLPLPDGSTLIQDPLNRRFLAVSADGKLGAFVDMPRPPSSTGNGGPVMMIGGFDARGTDSQGRIYFQAAPFGPGGTTLDSVAILRWDRSKSNMDTVGFVKLPPGSASASSSGGNMRVMIGGGKRFTPTETWGVAADGRVARVLPEPYRVVWMSGPSQMAPGPIVPYTPMKVTEADKQEFIEAQKRNRPMMITMGGPGPGPRPGGGGGGNTNFQPPAPEFMDTKPPFVAGPNGGGAVVVTPEGEVWVLRTRPAGDKIPTYDIFDPSGTLIKKVSLNPNSRVAGFGKGTVYVVRTDEDDLQYLQRYARP